MATRNPASAHESAGFTLLEMLFVLFIIGLMAGLVGPRFGIQIERLERQSRAQEIEDQLHQLPRRARLAGQNLTLPKDLRAELGDGLPVIFLPEGWTIQFEPPWLVAANGACSATQITLTPPGGDGEEEAPRRYKVAELNCEIAPITQ
ncbi:MAG: hypothetical protein MOGDAGHF_02746 [Rhodocyclaceae bacterium]|nr:hypothetical protein [Rhodocyclaceae bacterium]